ncbi:MAG: hypothetical protein GX434_01055 [Peptococcaceae bacterium]|nr:hypothetical protein [Peptococcaceae bacterium]
MDMEMRKKFNRYIFLLLSIILTSLTGYWFFHSVQIAIPFSALCFAWSILIIVSVLDLFLNFRLPESYYKIGKWKNEMVLYKKLDIIAFRNVIRRGPLHVLAPQIQINNIKISLELLELEMQRAETIHVIAMLIAIVPAIISITKGMIISGILLIGFSILMHAYPIMLQRYNRSRLNKISKLKISTKPDNGIHI